MAILDELSRQLGEILAQRRLQVAFDLVTPDAVLEPDSVTGSVNADAGTARVRLAYADRVVEEIYVEWDGTDIVLHRHTRNIGTASLDLVETRMHLCGIDFGAECVDDYFYHTENPRIFDRLGIEVALKRTSEMVEDSGFDALAGNRWADPGVVSERIGNSPYQPFPAILLSNHGVPTGIVHGSLSQRVFYHNYLVEHTASGLNCTAHASFKAIDYRHVQPGEWLVDRAYLGVAHHAADVERVFAEYTAVLRHHLPPLFGQGTHNRHTVVWGSWNDGINRNIDQERLLKQADFLAAELPTVEWMQIDNGYDDLCRRAGKPTHQGLSMPYEGEHGVDRTKFPDGLKAFTDAVRERGIKPAVWIGGSVPKVSPLYQDHPDWMADYARFADLNDAVLDVSVPAVRDYMMRALDAFIHEHGFDAVKQDFWSYAFEDSTPMLASREKSGYEWRRWWLQQFRDRLPDYGYFQTGCDIVMANPFLAEWYTNYRYGIDVGAGQWDHFRTNLLWGAACFALQIGDLFVPNSDSIGLLPGLSDDEALSVINYCLISRSLVEVAGWLYQQPNHPRLAWVRKALCCPNNGQHVHFAGYDYRTANDRGPTTWFLDTPHFSLQQGCSGLPQRTVAVFNVTEAAQTFSLDPETLDLAPGRYLATNVWTLGTEPLASLAQFTIPAHGSRLLALNPDGDTPQLLDADGKVTDCTQAADALELKVARSGDLTLALSHEPKTLTIGGQPHACDVRKGAGNWLVTARLTRAGSLVLRF